MKRVMTSVQAKLFRDRSIIESDRSVLKGRMGLDTHIARGRNGLFRHYFYCLSTFLLFGSSSELNDRYQIA